MTASTDSAVSVVKLFQCSDLLGFFIGTGNWKLFWKPNTVKPIKVQLQGLLSNTIYKHEYCIVDKRKKKIEKMRFRKPIFPQLILWNCGGHWKSLLTALIPDILWCLHTILNRFIFVSSVSLLNNNLSITMHKCRKKMSRRTDNSLLNCFVTTLTASRMFNEV